MMSWLKEIKSLRLLHAYIYARRGGRIATHEELTSATNLLQTMIKPIIKVKHCHRADDMDDNFLTEKIVLPVLRNRLPHNHRVWQ